MQDDHPFFHCSFSTILSTFNELIRAALPASISEFLYYLPFILNIYFYGYNNYAEEEIISLTLTTFAFAILGQYFISSIGSGVFELANKAIIN